jgi:hypothetical protein
MFSLILILTGCVVCRDLDIGSEEDVEQAPMVNMQTRGTE